MSLENYYEVVSHIRQKWSGIVKHIVSYGHLGDGNVHLNIIDHEYSEERLDLISEDVFHFAIRSSGSISAEHGLGREKNKYLQRIYSEQTVHLMKSIKRQFDPLNLLNPGKVYY